jgi:transposase
MAKFKPCNYDQLVMLPICLKNQLVPGTLEDTINELVENHPDLSVFEGRYQNNDTDATALNPKILLKIILFAYSRGMISSRQIERACTENIIFIALCCGYSPDHSTIAHFLSSMQQEIDEMKAKIDTPQEKQIYARRLGIVEPVFANICVQKHMNRFTLRTKSKVDVLWKLFALVHNIGKIYSFGSLH